METKDTERIENGSFILNLSIGSIRTHAKVKRERVEKMAEALIDKDEPPETVAAMASDGADEIRVSKELLRVEEIKDLINEMNNARNTIRANAIKTKPPKRKDEEQEVAREARASIGRFLKDGMYLYSAMKVEWAEGQIAQAQARIDALIDALEPKWEAVLREDERRLRPLGLFDPRDYPTLAAIREASRIRYAWLRFSVPEALERLNPVVFRAEREKAKAMWAEVFDDIRLAYRETLAEFAEKIRAALVPGEDGKRRVLRQSTLDNLTEFLNGFRLQDVTDDKELAALIDRAKAALNGSDAEVLRTESRAAQRVATAMAEVGEAAKALAVVQGRKVQLRD
jgi:hypothetical protein